LEEHFSYFLRGMFKNWRLYNALYYFLQLYSPCFETTFALYAITSSELPKAQADTCIDQDLNIYNSHYYMAWKSICKKSQNAAFSSVLDRSVTCSTHRPLISPYAVAKPASCEWSCKRAPKAWDILGGSGGMPPGKMFEI
jgi:hypothetical protein